MPELIRVTAEGFLFVGDPHVSSRRPARRLDEDFLGTSLKKMARAVRIANAANLVAVFLGDLTDRPDDTHRRLIHGLIRIARGARHKPICMDGNHDADDLIYAGTDGLEIEDEMLDGVLGGGETVLAMLSDAGLVHGIFADGPAAVLETAAGRVLLGASPYGKPIPTEVDTTGYSQVVWMTHHDLNFEGAYPGCMEPHFIAGCDLVVNGHMHRTMQPVEKTGPDGAVTRWFNPGNILRQSIKDREHEPAVWRWQPGMGLPDKIPVEHEKEVFDLTGLRLFQAEIEGVDPLASRFIDLLKREHAAEISKTDGAEVLREEAAVLAGELKLSEQGRSELAALFGTPLATLPEGEEVEEQVVEGPSPL